MNWQLEAIGGGGGVTDLSAGVGHVEIASDHDGAHANAYVTMTREFTRESDAAGLDYLSVRLVLSAVEDRASVRIGTFSVREVILDSGIYALRLASSDDTRALTG